MTDSAYIAELLAAVFFLIVGIRLLRLSGRTGEAPEKLLGIYFSLTGLSYLAWLVHPIFDLKGMQNELNRIGWSLYSIGVVPFMLFARQAFRPDTAWANWMVGSCTLLLFAGTTMGNVQGGDYYVFDNPWFWCTWLGYTIPCLWVSVEAFRSYARANRRVRVGLCDRVVANRYLLFGCFGAFQTFACVADIFEVMDYAADKPVSGEIDLLFGVLEMAAIVMLFFAFFPPAFYRSWIRGAAPVAKAVEG